MNTWPFPTHTQAPITPAMPAPRPGVGTRLTVNALGHSYSAAPQGRTFNHPFRPALSGGRVTFTLGIVDVYIPLIGGVPMNGADGNTPTPLPLDGSVAVKDAAGTLVSWVMLEVVPNAQGVLDVKSRIELLHSGDPSPSNVATLGRQPIAQIVWSGSQAVQAIAIVRFHLRYQLYVPTAGGGVPKHFFL